MRSDEIRLSICTYCDIRGCYNFYFDFFSITLHIIVNKCTTTYATHIYILLYVPIVYSR